MPSDSNFIYTTFYLSRIQYILAYLLITCFMWKKGKGASMPCKYCARKWMCFFMRKPNLVKPLFGRLTKPKAVDEVLRHYNKGIWLISLENAYINKDTEATIKRRLVAALF